MLIPTNQEPGVGHQGKRSLFVMLLCLAYWFFFSMTAVSDLYDQHRVEGFFSTYTTPTKVHYGLVIHPQQTRSLHQELTRRIQFSGFTSTYESNETLRRVCLEGASPSRLHPIKEEFPSLIIGSDHQASIVLGRYVGRWTIFRESIGVILTNEQFPNRVRCQLSFSQWAR